MYLLHEENNNLIKQYYILYYLTNVTFLISFNNQVYQVLTTHLNQYGYLPVISCNHTLVTTPSHDTTYDVAMNPGLDFKVEECT